MLETTKSIYAKDKSTFLIIESTLGLITPPELEIGITQKGMIKLNYICCFYDLFTIVHNKCKEDFTQKSLGKFLGFTQQHIYRFIDRQWMYPCKPEKVEKLLELFFRYFTLPERVMMTWHSEMRSIC